MFDMSCGFDRLIICRGSFDQHGNPAEDSEWDLRENALKNEMDDAISALEMEEETREKVVRRFKKKAEEEEEMGSTDNEHIREL